MLCKTLVPPCMAVRTRTSFFRRTFQALRAGQVWNFMWIPCTGHCDVTLHLSTTFISTYTEMHLLLLQTNAEKIGKGKNVGIISVCICRVAVLVHRFKPIGWEMFPPIVWPTRNLNKQDKTLTVFLPAASLYVIKVQVLALFCLYTIL